MTTPILILPGYGDSGPAHWQSRWQAMHLHIYRVVQRDWDFPACSDWVAALEQAVAAQGAPCVLAAHSLGCLLAAHWATHTRLPIKGALLVAPPDPAGPAFPPLASGFAPVPMVSLPFASIVVASTDDPYDGRGYAQACASAWGSRFVGIGAAGHINGESGLGDWPQGWALLDDWLR